MNKDLTFKPGSEDLQRIAELESIAKELRSGQGTKARRKELYENWVRLWTENVINSMMDCELTPEQYEDLTVGFAKRAAERNPEFQPDDDETDDDDCHPWPSDSR